MPLVIAALLAALAGATEALPLSSSGHALVARLWLPEGPAPRAATTAALVGAALGLTAAAWRRLAAAAGDGVRAVARPALFGASQGAHDALALFIASAMSVGVSLVTLPRVEMWASSPLAAGIGLCATGLSVGSTALAPRIGAHEATSARPSLVGAALVGVAHGLAVFPGASRVGAALTVLLWIGVKPARAVDLALLLTAPALLAVAAQGPFTGASLPALSLVTALAALGAVVGAGALRGLVDRRRLGVLALWIVPLGLALLAYARALPRAV